jgi:glycogen synthase
VTRLRVLHCIYDHPANPWVGGGGARRAFELYRRLRGDVDVTLVTARFPGAVRTDADLRVEMVGAAWPYLLSRATYSLAATRRLRRRDYDAALVDYSAYAPVLVSRDAPVGFVVHHLFTEPARQRWGDIGAYLMTRLEHKVLGRARWFSATSSTTARELAGIVPSSARIAVVTAGVPEHLFYVPREEADHLLYLGRVDVRHKGLDVLLDALAKVDVRRWQRLIVAGRGPSLQRLREHARRIGIDSHVVFMGAVDDDARERLLAGARLLVMPSRFEGFGMVAAEAMAAGVPVVASDVGALPEVLDAPHAGVVVPAGDADALASAIASLLEDPERRRRMGASARTSAQRFRWDAVAAEHLAMLQRIAADSSDSFHRLS